MPKKCRKMSNSTGLEFSRLTTLTGRTKPRNMKYQTKPLTIEANRVKSVGSADTLGNIPTTLDDGSTFGFHPIDKPKIGDYVVDCGDDGALLVLDPVDFERRYTPLADAQP